MLRRRWRLAFLSIVALLSFVNAQFSGGQFFTAGLAIISSPEPGSTQHVGSTLSISIAVGGNQGQLKDFSAGGSSADGTGYDSMQLFLISAQHNLNVTVTNDLLTADQDTGNVKHFNYNFPTCLPSGPYNLSLYETSRFQNNPLFVITQVPINVENNKQSGDCSDNNSVQDQPQDDQPLTGSPWIGGPGVSKLATTGQATLATTNTQLLASQPDPPALTTQAQTSTQTQPTSSQVEEASSTSTSIVQATQTAALPPPPAPAATSQSEQNTATQIQTQTANSVPQAKASVLVKTITVTTATFLPTVGAGGSQGSILFPVSGSKSLTPTSLFPASIFFVLALSLL